MLKIKEIVIFSFQNRRNDRQKSEERDNSRYAMRQQASWKQDSQGRDGGMKTNLERQLANS